MNTYILEGKMFNLSFPDILEYWSAHELSHDKSHDLMQLNVDRWRQWFSALSSDTSWASGLEVLDSQSFWLHPTIG